MIDLYLIVNYSKSLIIAILITPRASCSMLDGLKLLKKGWEYYVFK
jgi:hypothetical protein